MPSCHIVGLRPRVIDVRRTSSEHRHATNKGGGEHPVTHSFHDQIVLKAKLIGYLYPHLEGRRSNDAFVRIVADKQPAEGSFAQFLYILPLVRAITLFLQLQYVID